MSSSNVRMFVDHLSNNWHATYNKRTKDFFQKVLLLGQAIAKDHKVRFMSWKSSYNVLLNISNHCKADINHIQKFDGSYFHVLKHRIWLIFKQEKLLLIFKGIEAKPMAPIITKITASVVANVAQWPSTSFGGNVDWEVCDTLVVSLINNCLLDNSMISHV